MKSNGLKCAALFTGGVVLAVASYLPGQYLGETGSTPPRQPFINPTGPTGPPLSTALPTSGAFSHGIVTTGRPPATGRPAGTSRPVPTFVPPRPNYPNNLQPQLFLPPPTISGRDMARVARWQGVFGNLRF